MKSTSLQYLRGDKEIVMDKNRDFRGKKSIFNFWEEEKMFLNIVRKKIFGEEDDEGEEE